MYTDWTIICTINGPPYFTERKFMLQVSGKTVNPETKFKISRT